MLQDNNRRNSINRCRVRQKCSMRPAAMEPGSGVCGYTAPINGDRSRCVRRGLERKYPGYSTEELDAIYFVHKTV